MYQSMKVFTAAVLLSMSFVGLANATENKRPPTPEECDPTRWTIDPNVDYSYCEESNNKTIPYYEYSL